jgi:hypothetical protein
MTLGQYNNYVYNPNGYYPCLTPLYGNNVQTTISLPTGSAQTGTQQGSTQQGSTQQGSTQQGSTQQGNSPIGNTYPISSTGNGSVNINPGLQDGLLDMNI